MSSLTDDGAKLRLSILSRRWVLLLNASLFIFVLLVSLGLSLTLDYANLQEIIYSREPAVRTC